MCAQPSAILYISVMDLMMTTSLVETCCLFDTFMVIKNTVVLTYYLLYKALYLINEIPVFPKCL